MPALYVNAFPSPPARRDQLKRHYNLGQYWLQVELEDLSSFDAMLADRLTRLPSEYLPLVSRPARARRALFVSRYSSRFFNHLHGALSMLVPSSCSHDFGQLPSGVVCWLVLLAVVTF